VKHYPDLLDKDADHPFGAVIPLRIAAARLRLSAVKRIEAARAELAAALVDYDESTHMFYSANSVANSAGGARSPLVCGTFAAEGVTPLVELREILARRPDESHPVGGLLAAIEKTP